MNLINERIKHITLGTGTIIAQDDRYITVEFSSKTSRFQYPGPDTFVKFLRAEDESIQVAILQEIAEQKRLAEEARAAAEEAKRKAEEARAAELERAAAEAAAKRRGERLPIPREPRIPGKPMTFYVFQGDTFTSRVVVALFGPLSLAMRETGFFTGRT